MNWETIITMAGKLATETTSKYGPVAWDTVLWLVRVDAIQTLFLGCLFLIGFILSVYWGKKLFIKGLKEAEPHPGVLGFFLLLFGGGGFGIAVLDSLLNIWIWVGIIYPELYLAKMALDKVL